MKNFLLKLDLNEINLRNKENILASYRESKMTMIELLKSNEASITSSTA